MAGACRGENRAAPGEDYSRSIGESESGCCKQAIHVLGRGGAWGQGPVLAQRLHPGVKGIADTGFLVAFANRGDRHHEWAVEIAERRTEPLLTCEAVLAEAAFHLQDTALVLSMVRDGLVRLAFDGNDHMPQLTALAERYADRCPDFADLCLVRLSELNPRYSVVTVDRADFRVYRRNKREAIPLVTPPDR